MSSTHHRISKTSACQTLCRYLATLILLQKWYNKYLVIRSKSREMPKSIFHQQCYFEECKYTLSVWEYAQSHDYF